MELLNVIPKDVHLIIDLSVEEIRKLMVALNHCQIIYDSKQSPEVKDAANFLKDCFFNQLDEFMKDIDRIEENEP